MKESPWESRLANMHRRFCPYEDEGQLHFISDFKTLF